MSLRAFLGSACVLFVTAWPVAAQDGGRYILLGRLAADYEWQLRGFAPRPARSGFPCDETVGRFCLRYNDGSRMSFRPEGPELLSLRAGLLVDLHATIADLPHDTLVSGRLVRVLIEARETRAAIEAALAFTAADTTDAWSYALLGMSLFADGQLDAAARVFALASPRLNDNERARMRNAEWLLELEEREVYEAAAHTSGRRSAWRICDQTATSNRSRRSAWN
ncbi:MAG: hypothetical protein WEF86_16120 [Gemmatimonadota bacterium]